MSQTLLPFLLLLCPVVMGGVMWFAMRGPRSAGTRNPGSSPIQGDRPGEIGGGNDDSQQSWTAQPTRRDGVGQ